MTKLRRALMGASALCAAAGVAAAQDTTITIATVNNGDMIRMQGTERQLHRRESRYSARMGHA